MSVPSVYTWFIIGASSGIGRAVDETVASIGRIDIVWACPAAIYLVGNLARRTDLPTAVKEPSR